MFSGERIFPVAAVVILLLIATLIVNVITTATTGDYNPFERDEVARFLEDVNDSEGAYTASIATAVVVDGFLGPLLGVMLYLLFRERHRLLAMVTLAFILVTSAVSLAADTLSVATLNIASDFVEGGAGDIAAGDAATLEVGRAVSMAQFATMQAGFSAVSIAFLALGLLVSFAPERGVVPTRWIGWIFLLAGVAGVLSWTIVLTEAGFVFFVIAGISQLVGLAALAVWLLRSQGDEESMMAGATAAA
jgi:hypothetical protein